MSAFPSGTPCDLGERELCFAVDGSLVSFLPAGLGALLRVLPLHMLLLAAWGDCWLGGVLGFMTLIPICVFPKGTPTQMKGRVQWKKLASHSG